MRRLGTVAIFATLLAVAVLVGSLVAGLGGGAKKGSDDGGAPVRPETRVRVEVLNAAGTPGLAREATRRLRDRGFDVVYFGNAPGERRDSSEVLDRSGQLESARAVADALAVRRVSSEPDADLYLDVSVILGRDWEPAARDGDGVSRTQ